MKLNLKRVLSGVAALAVAASAAPFIGAPAAFAAGSPQTPGAGVTPTSGDSSTAFTLTLPSGASCPGDSPNDGWRWQTYMVPASVDPGTLTFGSNGPLPAGVGANFRQPLFTTTGSPVVNKSTPAADTPGGPGPIVNIPQTNYAVFAPGDIPAGSYNIGIACTLGGASSTQMSRYWNVQKTFTTSTSGGPAQVVWAKGARPAAPVLSSPLGTGDGTLTATFTSATADPAASLYTATATPAGGGTPVTASSPTGSPITIGGLTNGTTYSVTVRATNSVGDSPESNVVSGTPNPAARPAVQNLSATPGTGKVDLNWDAPTGPTPTSYTVNVNPAGGTTTIDNANTSASITGLTAGTVYTFTVTPIHPSPYVGTPASVQATPFDAQVLRDQIAVTRPVGAIVLTQVCGKNGDIPADTSGTPGFPNGSLPAIAAAGPGTAPVLTAGGTDGDPKFGEYPYPENADGTPAPNYPTNCGIDLGVAKFVRKGPGAGQFFAASGKLNQVTIVDTRDTDTGWTVTGTTSSFNGGPGKTFSGSQLGWSPVKTSDTPAFTDSDGTTYDQVVTAGPVVSPNSANASGLSSGRTLGSAAAGSGLGISELDARLKLLIPVTAKSGLYNATLTVTVTGG